jgi:hypothetical protein
MNTRPIGDRLFQQAPFAAAPRGWRPHGRLANADDDEIEYQPILSVPGK